MGAPILKNRSTPQKRFYKRDRIFPGLYLEAVIIDSFRIIPGNVVFKILFLKKQGNPLSLSLGVERNQIHLSYFLRRKFPIFIGDRNLFDIVERRGLPAGMKRKSPSA